MTIAKTIASVSVIRFVGFLLPVAIASLHEIQIDASDVVALLLVTSRFQKWQQRFSPKPNKLE